MQKDLIISKLELTNFQKHNHLILDFSLGMTAITGSSDTGKSAIFKALQFLLFETVADAQYMTYAIGDVKAATEVRVKATFVSVSTGKEYTLERFKNTKDSGFIVNGEAYNKSGKGLGSEFFADYIQLDGNINFANQMDGHFLIGKSKEEAGKFIQKLFGLDTQMAMLVYFISKDKVYRSALKNTTSEYDILAQKTGGEFESTTIALESSILECEKLESESIEIQKQLESLDVYVQQEKIVSFLQNIPIDKCLLALNEYTTEEKRLLSIRGLNFAYSDALNSTAFVQLVEPLIETFIEILTADTTISNQLNLIDEFNKSSNFVNSSELLIEKFSNIVDIQSDIDKNKTLIEQLELWIKYTSRSNEYQTLENLLIDLANSNQIIDLCDRYRDCCEMILELDSQLAEFADFLCPTCGQLTMNCTGVGE